MTWLICFAWLAIRRSFSEAGERRMVAQIFPRWNPLTSWLRQIDGVSSGPPNVRLGPFVESQTFTSSTVICSQSTAFTRPSRRRGDYSIDRYSTNG